MDSATLESHLVVADPGRFITNILGELAPNTCSTDGGRLVAFRQYGQAQN